MSLGTTLLMAVVLIGQPAATVDESTLQSWFEAGEYEQVVREVEGRSEPAAEYLAALAYERLERPAEARAMLTRLTIRSEPDAWRALATAAVLLDTPPSADVPTPVDDALAAARRATASSPGLAEAHYQLGLVQARRRDYEAAAAAFEAAIVADPRFAYAHSAGLAYNQLKRTDKMAIAFEFFLKVAPNAPERERVQSIMRTLRGRR